MASSRAFCALAAILPRRLARSEYLVPEGSSVRFRESRSMHASSVRALSRPAPAHRSRTVFGGRERDVTREERCAPQDSRSSRAATPDPQTPPRATPDLSPPSPSVSRTPATETGHAPRGLRPRRPGDARALQVRLPAPHPLPAAATHANLLFAILETASARGRGIFSSTLTRGAKNQTVCPRGFSFSAKSAMTFRRSDASAKASPPTYSRPRACRIRR